MYIDTDGSSISNVQQNMIKKNTIKIAKMNHYVKMISVAATILADVPRLLSVQLC